MNIQVYCGLLLVFLQQAMALSSYIMNIEANQGRCDAYIRGAIEDLTVTPGCHSNLFIGHVGTFTINSYLADCASSGAIYFFTSSDCTGPYIVATDTDSLCIRLENARDRLACCSNTRSCPVPTLGDHLVK